MVVFMVLTNGVSVFAAEADDDEEEPECEFGKGQCQKGT